MTSPQYGIAHQRERERWKPHVDAGRTYCTEPLCLMTDRWIPPGTPWDLAHDRTTGTWRGPAHRRCNRSEGAVFRLQRRPSIVIRWEL